MTRQAPPRSPMKSLKMRLPTCCKHAGEEKKPGRSSNLFTRLKEIREQEGITCDRLGIPKEQLQELAIKHQQIDEHMVSVGGRVGQAQSIVRDANNRVDEYLERNGSEAASGIELWDAIRENQQRIKKELNISEDEWNSFSGQIRHAIDSVDILTKLIDLDKDSAGRCYPGDQELPDAAHTVLYQPDHARQYQ